MSASNRQTGWPRPQYIQLEIVWDTLVQKMVECYLKQKWQKEQCAAVQGKLSSPHSTYHSFIVNTYSNHYISIWVSMGLVRKSVITFVLPLKSLNDASTWCIYTWNAKSLPKTMFVRRRHPNGFGVILHRLVWLPECNASHSIWTCLGHMHWVSRVGVPEGFKVGRTVLRFGPNPSLAVNGSSFQLNESQHRFRCPKAPRWDWLLNGMSSSISWSVRLMCALISTSPTTEWVVISYHAWYYIRRRGVKAEQPCMWSDHFFHIISY